MILRNTAMVGTLASLLFLGCDNDKGTGPGSGSQSALLTAKGWKKTADVVAPGYDDGTGRIITDQYAEEGGCSHDDLTTFMSNGKFSVDEGASKCSPSDPQIETGTWTLNSAGTQLKLVSDLDSLEMSTTVEQLTATTLKISMSGDFGDGVTHKETLTFTAQ